ncbi:SPOSA6832_01410, partial [Sporobolomyces salmonicolor]
MVYALSLLAALTVVSLPHLAKAWFPGVEQRFVDERLIDTGALGLPKTGLVAAFADYNADQLVDLFYLSSDQRSLSVWTWDRQAYEWKEATETRIRTKGDFVITNVVPGDFNYDGKLDVLLMGGKNPGGWWGADETTDMQVYLQQPDGSLCAFRCSAIFWRKDNPLTGVGSSCMTAEAYSVDSSTLAQAMPLDATGDMRTDLLGFSPDDKSVPRLWNNSWAASNHTSIFSLGNAPLDLTSSPTNTFNCHFPSPHFNAFIDLDGDCLADLFFMCQNNKDDENDLSFQIWLNDKESGKFRFAKGGSLPRGTKSVGFADMDRDGSIDMVLTSCTSTDDCTLSIAYNDQIPLCDSSPTSTGPCRDPEALCVADKDFSFNLSTDNNPSFTRIPLSALFPSQTLVTSSTSFRGAFPTAPQIGDYNIDGYPDLLLLTQKGSSKTVNLLQSRPCEKVSCSEEEIKKGRRGFRVVEEGATDLANIKDAESAHWVDVDDDGSLDILVQRSGNSGAARQAVWIKNNYFNDAFFLKAMDGQLPQSTYLTLSTPYSYFGLGRTNNYVENLFIGSTRHQPQHYINVEGVIPNSQVLIIPYQPEGSKDPGSWAKELYLHPGDWIPWVTIVLVGAILGLGVVVLVLHLNEKREDEIERRARLLSLNFQAL